MEEYIVKKPLFGKEVEIVIYDMDESLAQKAADKAYDAAKRLNDIFDMYDENSEISLLNKRRKMVMSPEFVDLLKTAAMFYRLTDGEYDVSLGKTFLNRKKGNKETVKCSFDDITIDGYKVSLGHDDVLLDLGSIAKGYIVDKMAQVLKEEGVTSGIVNGRGDIKVIGMSPQKIGIQHPREKETIIASINVTDSGVATSGDYSQYYGNFDMSHILNSKNLISITVVAPNLVTADVFATAFFVSEGTELLKKYNDLKIMTIDKNLNVKYYNDFELLL